MGGGNKKGQTSVPNFQGAATSQSLSSRPNWGSSFGGQSWQIDPSTGQASMQVQTPQALQGAVGNLQNNMTAASQYDPTQARNQAIQSNYGQQMGFLQPQFQQQNNQFASQMANMGADPGTAAYQTGQGNLGRQQAFQQGNAANNAIQQGNQTQMTQMAQMNQPFQQYGQLQNSIYANPYMGQPANYLGAAQATFGANQANTSAQNNKKNSMMGGMGQMGSMMGSKGAGAGAGAAGGAGALGGDAAALAALG